MPADLEKPFHRGRRRHQETFWTRKRVGRTWDRSKKAEQDKVANREEWGKRKYAEKNICEQHLEGLSRFR